ncbi:MAG: protoglobin domain-containing protein [Burkholderiales bacterium]
MNQPTIAGYTYGNRYVPHSPLSLEELDLLKKTVLLADEDIKYLRMSHEILKDQTSAVLDVWYGFVGSQPHLVYYFSRKSDAKPSAEYLAAVRKRFEQWILDTAAANYDQKWLDYQYEIGLRHHRTAKNKTDKVESVDIINYRYLPALIYPVTATLKPFLANKGHAAAEVDKMHQAWIKSVLLQVILWTQPYVKDGDF